MKTLKLLPLLLLALPAAVQAQYAYSTNADGSIYTFSTNADGSSTIVAYAGPPWAVTIPTNIDGLPVTGIGNGGGPVFSASLTNVTIPDSVINIGNFAFSSCSGLTNVTIGNSVTNIGNDAFNYCTSLTSVTIPGSVTSIGVYAFNQCTKLANVTISNGVIIIGNEAFYYCGSLTNVTIPGSVTSIGVSAFQACTSLTSVTIPGGVTNIGDGAFWYTGVASISIPSSVTSIGAGAFVGENLTAITVAPQNLFYSSTNGALFDKGQTTLIQYPAAKTGSAYTIPNTVTTIASEAFSFSGLASITIPSSVTTFENGAFYDCSLISVTIPSSVTNIIGNDPFGFCTSLIAIAVDINNPVYSGTNGVLFDKRQSTLIQYPGGKVGGYIIPESVTNIEGYAFEGCALTGVSIPSSVASIQQYTFYQCENLTNITLPESVTSIGIWAFAESGSLTNVTFLGNVTSIGGYAFYYCPNLTSVHFTYNAPTLTNDSSVFLSDNKATVYYLPGTAGWGSKFDGRPTALWLLPNPMILNNSPSFGVQANGFGFIISWATNISVVVEATTNLANPIWSPVQTNILTGGTSYFSDSHWTNYPGRYYRLRSP